MEPWRSTASSTPSPDGDVVVASSSGPLAGVQKAGDIHNIDEEHKNLKRRHDQIDQKHNNAEVHKSGEQNVELQTTQITELESELSSGSASSSVPQTKSTATADTPRTISKPAADQSATAQDDGTNHVPSTRDVNSDTHPHPRIDDKPKEITRVSKGSIKPAGNRGTASLQHRSPVIYGARNPTSAAVITQRRRNRTLVDSVSDGRISSSHPHPRQHSSNLSSNENRTPPVENEDVEMSEQEGRDRALRHHNPGDPDTKQDANDKRPRRNATSSRRSEVVSVPSTRVTRRSTRIATTDQAGREPEKELISRTRGKRKASTSPSVKTRAKRRNSTAATASGSAANAGASSSSANQSFRQTTARPVDSSSPKPSSTQQTSPPTALPRLITAASQKPKGGKAPQTPSTNVNIDPTLIVPPSDKAKELETGLLKQPSPMENIVKVAEAAIAAQKAENATKNSLTVPTTTASQLPAANPSGASSSTPNTSYNPYMITALMVPNKNNVGMTPLAMNPYAMYYPPGAPVTPGTPTYPHGNPYYYLSGPMPSPGSVYSPTANFVPPSGRQRLPAEQHNVKPKRLKAHTVTSKSFSIPMVPRDKQGKPMLPLNVGIMTVISLGEVCMREHFHTERYIFPVGYEVTRRYLSTVNPNVEVVYHCTILDGGDGPKFQIVPSDVPDRTVIAGTATGAWSSIVKQANAIRNRQHSNSVSGPDFFGLGQNTIKHLIQELPNADRLRDYVWQTFIEGGPLGGRHAAVIPALPEEYDASMPIGAYYPMDRDKQKRDVSGTPETPLSTGLAHYPQHIIAQAEAQLVTAFQAQQQLKAGEPSGSQQPRESPQASEQGPSPVPSGIANFAISADRTGPQPMGSGANTSTVSQQSTSFTSGDELSSITGSAPVPATFASIMNAYSSTASGTATPT